MNDQELVDLMQEAWQAVDEVCSSLSADEWDRPTDCPGWTVKDNVSHITGTESMLLGRPAPDHQPAEAAHVRNPIGESNEVQVDYRRSWPPQQVLDEFREITGERLAQLRSWGDEDFSKETWTPVGPGTARDFVGIRIFDVWVHEQDIRRAVGKAGGLEGRVARHAFDRIASAMPYVVGKKAGAPNGSVVVFDVSGPAAGEVGIVVEGRAKILDDIPGEPTVRLALDLETFNALGCGRWDAARAHSEGRVGIDGDEDLGRRIVDEMNFMV